MCRTKDVHEFLFLDVSYLLTDAVWPVQLGHIYLDMLNVYKVMSENVSSAVASSGENVTKQPLIKSMRTVKKETLKLITSWVSRSCDPQIVCSILGCCIFCYGCMFGFVVSDLVFQYQAKRLAGNNISKVTYFVLATWDVKS